MELGYYEYTTLLFWGIVSMCCTWRLLEWAHNTRSFTDDLRWAIDRLEGD